MNLSKIRRWVRLSDSVGPTQQPIELGHNLGRPCVAQIDNLERDVAEVAYLGDGEWAIEMRREGDETQVRRTIW